MSTVDTIPSGAEMLKAISTSTPIVRTEKVLVRELKKGDLFRLNACGDVLERIADEPTAHSTDTFVARDNDSPSGMRCYILRGGYEVTRIEKPEDPPA